ncbi:butyrophilin subfamily 3 member A2-like [Sander lucioperca]|uniref:butyrophilin subfamily 3 member A2-like n=1 Tax=Sander lucioperca TaxID=283035 RepID=UPI0016537915|nr:butyrophilin subfamily 3 member A2-like [Sander lucioperca]
MYYRLFLLAALLPSCSGESSVDDPAEMVLAFAGGVVLLPCNFSIPASADVPTVEWSKQGLHPYVVFLYRGGYEINEEKHPAFWYRTSLIAKEQKNGNFSLRIANVRPSDAGKYRCKRLWSDGPRDVTAVELDVVAVSEPKLSVTSAEGGGVTLQCEANCWLPEPQINFLDEQGKYINAEEPKRDDEDARGCFTVTRRVTLQDAAANRVTCRVHQPETNQTRETQIFIPVDGGRSCFLTAATSVGVTVLLLSAPLCGLAVCLWKRCGKSEGQKFPVKRKLSDQSTTSGSSENHSLLHCVVVEKADCVVEKLTIEDLKTKLREKEDTIRQLQSENKSHLSSVVCQPDQPMLLHSHADFADSSPPESDRVPQKKTPKPGIMLQNSDPSPDPQVYRFRRRNSSPALLNFLTSSSAVSASKMKFSSIGRSKSETREPPLPFAKPQRRHSSVFPPSNNRFKLLADLTEEP